MERMCSTGQNEKGRLGPDKRSFINQSANGAQPEKELQEIINCEGAASPAGQYAQMLLDVMPETIQKIQPIKDMKVLPMQITARNEEIALPQTVRTLMYSAMEFQKNHPGFHVAILVCNNASTDETTAAVAQVYHDHKEELINNHVSIEVIYEGKPGKINGIRKGVKHIEQRFTGQYTHILSGDADVEWDKGAVNALWKVAHPVTGKRPLLVGSNITPRNRKTLWGNVELHVYLGYGFLPPRNQGLFMRFVSGMGYLADKSVQFHWGNVPDYIGLDDVVLSTLVGPENIAIAPDAIVRYDLSEDWDTFVKIRGRHLTEILRIERWLSEKYGEEKGVAMVSTIAELCAVRIVDGFFKPIDPLEPLDGSLFKNAGKIVRHIKSVPMLKLPFMLGVAGTFLLATIYPYLTYKGIKQNYKVSWWIALIGLCKKDIGTPYVKFLQNRESRESKEEEKTQVASKIKNSLWDPSLQRKNLKTVQYKGLLFHVREILSNNMNWLYAVLVTIAAFIYEFIFRHLFLFISEKSSVLAKNMPAPDIAISNSNQALGGTFTNNLKNLLESLSKVTSFISQHIPITAIILCLIIYIYLFIFHALRSIKNKKSFGSKFIDSLKSSGKVFLKIIAFPFDALDKGVLCFAIVPATFARLIFKKRS